MDEHKLSNSNTVSILLVEDDEVDAMGVERALKSLRVANPLIRARNGQEGLELLRNNVISKPFLILLDLNMPVMGGLEMLEELRKDPDLRNSVVFVLTTSDAEDDIAAAYREHIAGYIVKSKLGKNFNELFRLLDYYWRIIELPNEAKPLI